MGENSFLWRWSEKGQLILSGEAKKSQPCAMQRLNWLLQPHPSLCWCKFFTSHLASCHQRLHRPHHSPTSVRLHKNSMHLQPGQLVTQMDHLKVSLTGALSFHLTHLMPDACDIRLLEWFAFLQLHTHNTHRGYWIDWCFWFSLFFTAAFSLSWPYCFSNCSCNCSCYIAGRWWLAVSVWLFIHALGPSVKWNSLSLSLFTSLCFYFYFSLSFFFSPSIRPSLSCLPSSFDEKILGWNFTHSNNQSMRWLS